jgi:hypothetical protein
MDEGAAWSARAFNVRVEKKNVASAARGRPARMSGDKPPAAKPVPLRRGGVWWEKCLMQRQPWWPAWMPAHAFGPNEKKRRSFNGCRGSVLASAMASGNR